MFLRIHRVSLRRLVFQKTTHKFFDLKQKAKTPNEFEQVRLGYVYTKVERYVCIHIKGIETKRRCVVLQNLRSLLFNLRNRHIYTVHFSLLSSLSLSHSLLVTLFTRKSYAHQPCSKFTHVTVTSGIFFVLQVLFFCPQRTLRFSLYTQLYFLIIIHQILT